MWVLNGPKGEIYYLVPGNEHIVGRKDGDLVLADDQSISRKHAVISVTHACENWADPNKLPVVNITETGSKYGTFINPDGGTGKMDKNSTQTLHDGDVVHFGLQWNVWRLTHKPVVVLMSTLTGSQKKDVRDIVGTLGGHVVNNWQSHCTHLTMSSFTMTVKAIIALAYGKAIVVPEFWRTFQMAVQNKTELPNYEDFVPPLAETIINKSEVSFLIKPERRQLFQEREFLFFTVQQHAEHACLVTAAGGSASIVDLNRIPQEKLIEPHIIVMQHLSNPSSHITQTPEAYMDVISYLQSHGKRVIPVSEIGLAILHCSTEKYCNPSFSFSSTMLSNNRNTVIDIASQQTLAAETQESETSQRRKRNNQKEKLVIPESGTVSKRTVDSTKKEDLESTLLADHLHRTEIINSREQAVEKSKICNEPTSSLSSKCGSLKRPRSEESVDADTSHLPKRASTRKPKEFSRILKPRIDNDADGLFDFASDKARTSERNEDNMFAFKRPMSFKVEDESNDEDMFSFQATDSFVEERTLPSLLSDETETRNNMKRKLSSDEESASSTFYKKPALEGVSALETDSGESQHFISAFKIKKEDSTEWNGINNSSIVVVKPLVASQSPTNLTKTEATVVHDTGTKNFKKFHKVQARCFKVLPHVIGSKDLVPYSKSTSVSISSLFNNNDDDEEEKDGQDDWAFQRVNQSKRKGQSRRL